MYCPQCGAANDDTAGACSTCGFDLGKYKQQWGDDSATPPSDAESTGQGPAPQAPDSQQPGYPPQSTQQVPRQRPPQGPYGAPPYQGPPHEGPYYQGPPYQQQYQRGYQPPPYQPQPGYYQARSPYGSMPRIPSYLGWAIAVLILCFWPTGIAAVVFASQVDNKVALGDIAGAMESSRKAKMWCWITFGIAIAFWVIGIAIAIIVATASVGIHTFTY
jgi:hypothetical protein